MYRVFIVCIGVAILCAFHWTGQIIQGTPQRSYLAVDGVLPDSLQELCDKSEVIVDAQVRTVYPTQAPADDARALITDSLIHVIRVVKGAGVPSDFVIAQMGGVLEGRSIISSQFSLMQPSERYILFLKGVKPARASALPLRPGLSRYDLVTYAGMFLVDGPLIHLPSDLRFRSNYDGKSPAEVLTEIDVNVKRAK